MYGLRGHASLRRIEAWLCERCASESLAKLECVATLRSGARPELLIVATDSSRNVRFPSFPGELLGDLETLLAEKSADPGDAMATLQIRVEAPGRVTWVSLSTDDEVEIEKRKRERDELRRTLPETPYGSAFADRVARFLSEQGMIFHRYDARDGDGHAFWRETEGPYRIGGANPEFGDRAPWREFASAEDFAEWLAGQSDQSLFDLGLTLDRAKLEQAMPAKSRPKRSARR